MTLTKSIDLTTLFIQEEKTFTLQKDFIDKVKTLGIMEIEPLLVEDTKIIGRLEKYQFLALLRDLFLEFKKLNDTEIIVDEGSCGICGKTTITSKWSSIRPIRKVIELRGNNSNETIHVAILSRENENLNFKFCNGFILKNGEKSENYGVHTKLHQFATRRQSELSEQ